MRRLAFALLLSACAHGQVASPEHEPRRATAPPTESEVRTWSHAILEAHDRGDVAALAEGLAASFVHFEGGTPSDRQTELGRVAKRKPGAPHIASRGWSNEHVFVHGDRALFIGEAAEHMGGNDSHGGQEFHGWYTLDWHREGDRWKLALWTWQRAGVAAARDMWNDMYRASTGFEKTPNKLLVDTVRDLKPGAALDVAMGQGRNALYLASRGWTVTGVDFADEGVRLARAAGAERGLALTAIDVDIDTYDFGVAKWDLVTMIYALDRVSWIEKIKPSLKPGGVFVLEYFHKDAPDGDGFATGQLAKLFAEGFVVLRDEVVDDRPDWAMDRATLVRFVAKKR
ncbi:MAG: methyltransferase domain-containing protein [Polyangiaceae bacterium]